MLPAGQRGIVISTQIAISSKAFSLGAGLDQQMLRTSLFFWDKLDLPAYDIFEVEDDDLNYLEDVGVLQRSPVALGQITDQDFHRLGHAHVDVFKSLEQTSPGGWSLATGETSFLFEDHETEVGRGALISLHNAVPIPQRDVPFEDILRFKERRHAELHQFRHHLDGVYQRVAAAADGPLALRSEVDDLAASLSVLSRVGKEAAIPFKLSSLKAGLNIAAGGRAFGVAVSQGMDVWGATLTGAAAALDIKIDVGFRGSGVTGTPYKYVSDMHSEL